MGTLYVVATPIGNLGDMTPRAVEVLRVVDLIAAEDTRHSATLMREFKIDTPMISYHQHNRSSRADRLGAALLEGDVALISDAGTPGISDPGHELIASAIAAGHRVVPIPGASSLLAAVVGSGIVPGPFMFVGFLPRSGDERASAISRALATGVPFVVFESPNRLAATLSDLARIDGDRPGVVARELSKLHEEFRRGTLTDLSKHYSNAESAVRGEVVIVIGDAATDSSAQTVQDSSELARSLLRGGMKPSKAARELSAITGMPAAEAYEIVTTIGREESSA
jgi:16S rRNA (cytidine1402-2'-O)-methyltransferase